MKKKIILVVLLFAIMFFFLLVVGFPTSNLINFEVNYGESTDIIDNPERGMYKAVYTICGLEKCSEVDEIDSRKLVHLRIGLGAYGTKDNTEPSDFTDEMLSSLANILEYYRQNNNSVILRFAYDDFEEVPNVEPPIEQIEKHIEQLKEIFFNYQDVIATIETSMIGLWGEQHGSDIVTEENINKLISAYLKNIPDNMTISVRQPIYYTYYCDVEYNNLYNNITNYADECYRIGIFNDGYLGSESDRGTFRKHPQFGWRKNEVSWLSNQATHTFYGGEAVKDKSTTGIVYNTSDYMIDEMFQTHTTYLNSGWDHEVIGSWKNSQYSGDDSVYLNESAYTYIYNHLGYRFVLRDSNYEIKDNKLILSGLIENVGAGNVINPKKVEIVLFDGNSEYSYNTDFNVNSILSKQTKEYKFVVELPEDIKNFDVYIRITSKYNPSNFQLNYSIQFGNLSTYNVKMWNEQIQGNYLGHVTVSNSKNIFVKNIFWYIIIIIILMILILLYEIRKENYNRI